MPPVDESNLTNVERWSVLADRIDEHRRETGERRRCLEQQELVAARQHLRLVPPDDDGQPV